MGLRRNSEVHELNKTCNFIRSRNWGRGCNQDSGNQLDVRKTYRSKYNIWKKMFSVFLNLEWSIFYIPTGLITVLDARRKRDPRHVPNEKGEKENRCKVVNTRCSSSQTSKRKHILGEPLMCQDKLCGQHSAELKAFPRVSKYSVHQKVQQVMYLEVFSLFPEPQSKSFCSYCRACLKIIFNNISNVCLYA